jgi:protein-tyrosine kinase
MEDTSKISKIHIDTHHKALIPVSNSGSIGWGMPVYNKSKRVWPNLDKMRENKCIGLYSDAPEMFRYKILRSRIQQCFAKKEGANSIMITSPNRGEGKTLTAMNMALVFAKEFHQTVLLVDCDFRKQDIHKRMGVPGKKGLTDYFLNNTPLNELIVWPGIQKMTLISGGKTVSYSAELLGSPKMDSLVREMKGRYSDRFIIFDVEPLLNSADAISFAPFVDGVVMVVEAGSTTSADIKNGLNLIPEEKFLGFVLNRR